MSGRYELRTQLGSGSYGTVFKSWDSRRNHKIAVKVEKIEDAKEPKLQHEMDILQRLTEVKGVPKVFEYYKEDEKACLVMEYLGKPIQPTLVSKPLIPHKAGHIVSKAIKVLRGIHNRSVLHRDLKPQNILFGRHHRRDKVYIIDYGLSTVFRQNSGAHIGEKEHSGFVGTKLFCSGNAFLGNEQSRRDDLESIVYVLVWMIKQSLPWCQVTGDQVTVIESRKLTSSALEICQYCPHEVCELLNYVKSLHFQDMPDYVYMMRLISRMRKLSKCGSLVSASWRPETLQTIDDNSPTTSKLSVPSPTAFDSSEEKGDDCPTPLLRPPVASAQLRLRIKALQKYTG